MEGARFARERVELQKVESRRNPRASGTRCWPFVVVYFYFLKVYSLAGFGCC